MFRSIVGAVVCALLLSACENVEPAPLAENQILFSQRVNPYCGPPDVLLQQRTCDAYIVRQGGAIIHVSGLIDGGRRAVTTSRGDYNRVLEGLIYTESDLYGEAVYRIVGFGDPDYEEVRQRYLNQTPH